MKYPILKSGLFRISNSDNAKESEFSLMKYLKRVFKNFGVPFIDKCCNIESYFPVRFDDNNGSYQLFTGTEWIPIPGQLKVNGLDIMEWDGINWNKVGTLNV